MQKKLGGRRVLLRASLHNKLDDGEHLVNHMMNLINTFDQFPESGDRVHVFNNNRVAAGRVAIKISDVFTYELSQITLSLEDY
ncbi:hypothetical protein FRX31_028904 [Thalictrum thalictroides]|uniref:Uncharacterized protein n=1 Tax=Thalictrum thalictroides TaxID=46969 RepID=A0A7J6VBC6_THATH|nr:hypothetical protein FRX31_028904 [Thalictrum thalictroides]